MKEKLIELLTLCLNDERLMTAIEYHNKEYIKCETTRHEAAFYDTRWLKTVTYELKDLWYKPNRILKKFESVYLKDDIQTSHRLSVVFSENPPLNLYYSPFIEETKKEIVMTIGFFKKRKVTVIETTKVYTPMYKLCHGLVQETLTKEEVLEFVEMYHTNYKKFRIQQDSDKLEKRINSLKPKTT